MKTISHPLWLGVLLLKGILPGCWHERLSWGWSCAFLPWVTTSAPSTLMVQTHPRSRGRAILFKPLLTRIYWPSTISCPPWHVPWGVKLNASEVSLPHSAGTKGSPMENKGRPSDPLHPSLLSPCSSSTCPSNLSLSLLSLLRRVCPGTEWVLSPFLNDARLHGIAACLYLSFWSPEPAF